MDLSRYHHFIAIAEELHFGRAARRLGIAQPQLSQSIKRLERDIGVRLIDRTHNHVALTAAGQAFLEEARRCVLYAERARRVARTAAGSEQSQLRVGFSSLQYGILAPALRRFWQDHPGVAVRLEEGGSEAQAEKLRGGTLDLGLMELNSFRRHEGLATRRLRSYRYVAVLPAHWREARKRRLRLRDLAGKPLILFPYQRTPDIHQRIFEACHQAGFEPQVIQEARRTQTIMSLVACELGMSLLPETAAMYRMQGVALRPVQDLPATVQADIAMAWVPPVDNPAQQLLMDAIVSSAVESAESESL